jgi:hypothetical protein
MVRIVSDRYTGADWTDPHSDIVGERGSNGTQ